MLPENIRERLASEFRFAADRMASEAEPPKVMYFFSVFFGEATRMLNQAWDADLVLVHEVTQTAYRLINGRMNEAASGQDRVIGLNEIILPKLTEVSAELASLYEVETMDRLGLLSALSTVAQLGYLTSGNGNYLYLKGHAQV